MRAEISEEWFILQILNIVKKKEVYREYEEFANFEGEVIVKVSELRNR